MSQISFVIPTLSEEQFLEKTLANLNNLSIPHEIILTDGGSKDRTLEIARRYTNKIVVWGESRRQTFGEAKNAGAALATGEFLVFIDADVIIPSPQAFFEEFLRVFNANPKLLASTVPLKPLAENRSLADAFFCAPLNWFYVISNNLFHSGNSSGEFQMIRRSAFEKIGGFVEGLPRLACSSLATVDGCPHRRRGRDGLSPINPNIAVGGRDQQHHALRAQHRRGRRQRLIPSHRSPWPNNVVLKTLRQALPSSRTQMGLGKDVLCLDKKRLLRHVSQQSRV